MIKTLKDFNFKGKHVLLRCDFNVPIENGEIVDDFRLRKTLPTINYLKENGAKIILISHLGQPSDNLQKKNLASLQEYSLKPVAQRLEWLLGCEVRFLKDCFSRKVVKESEKMGEGDVILLENLRFDKGEEENSLDFAKDLAKLGEIYVSEAFSVSHRRHASIITLPRLLPHAIGFLFEKEINTLTKIKEQPARPFVVVIGGLKIVAKISSLPGLLKNADYVLLGGKTANVVLTVKGICVGRPWPSDEKIVKIIRKLDITNQSLHLPIDVVVALEETGSHYLRETGPGNVRKEERIFDIGKGTIEKFTRIISEAKTIVWSGPLGFVEKEQFRQGTEAIVKAIVENKKSFNVAGGGDTIKTIKKFGVLDKFSYISTGGSAMLYFLAGERLPGIEALETQNGKPKMQ